MSSYAMTEEEFLAQVADLPPLPCCEFCGDDEAPLFQATPDCPLLCIPCDAAALVSVYPSLVAHIGAVVARAAVVSAHAAAARECICPGDEPVCPRCGYRWTHVSVYSDGSKTYTSKLVRDKLAALYGEAAAAHVVPVLS